VALKLCLQLNSTPVRFGYLKNVNHRLGDLADPIGVEHRASELHGFMSTARRHEVVELLRALAAAQCLSQALRLQSSLGYTALDWALLSGNQPVVAEVLQRAGNLCFRDLVPGRRGPFHLAVMGGSKECLDTLWRFFKKYSGSEAPSSFTAGGDHWSPTLFALLEWRDEDDNTPLSLACSLRERDTTLVELLLFAGANIAAVNLRSDFTPLMQACFCGATDVVRVLLCIIKSSAEIDDTIFDNNTHDSALHRHLRANARSRHLLKGRDVAGGGHLNPLSLFCCLPAARELSSGRQAVHLAAVGGHGEALCMLLDIGVSCAETDRHGDNVFHLLANGGHTDACVLVINCERTQWSAHTSLVRDKLLQTMQTRRQSLCCENYRGKTCAEVAVEGGHFALAKLLLEASVDIYRDEGIATRSAPALSLLAEILTTPSSLLVGASSAHMLVSSEMSLSERMLPVPPRPSQHRPLSVEREATVRSRSSSLADKIRDKNSSAYEEKEAEDAAAGDRAVSDDDPYRPPPFADEHSQRLAALRGALSVCRSPPRDSPPERHWEDDDAADDDEYLFALSALALRAMGDISSVASRSTHVVVEDGHL
jgi:ankyrin repeat protein